MYNNRKRTKSIIATDTPVKNQLMKDFAKRTANAKGKKKVRSNKAKISKKRGGNALSLDTIESSQVEMEEEIHLSDSDDESMHADDVGDIDYLS